MRSGKCPLSGINCEECGYYKEWGRCFLERILEVLSELTEALKSEDGELYLKLDRKMVERLLEGLTRID